MISLPRFRPFGSHVALAIALWSCASAARADDTGRALYHGHAADAPPAKIAGVERSGLTCAGCHGRNAAGGGEGRSRVPPIDGATLASPSPKRPAYDPATFRAAVSQGRASDGRTLSLAMPRFDLSQTQSDALWKYLGGITDEDRSGVSADQIQIAVPAITANLVDARHLRDELERQWAARGANSIHGRSIVFKEAAIDASASDGNVNPSDFFLALGANIDVDGSMLDKLQRSGLPMLGPKGALSDKTSEEIISVRANRDQVTDALFRLDNRTTTIVIDAALRAKRAPPSQAIGPEDAMPADSRRIVLMVGAAQARAFIKTHQVALKGRTVVVPFEELAGYPDLIEQLLNQGTDVLAARPAGDFSNIAAYASALTAVLEASLVTAGRQLTRTRLLEAVKGVQVQSPHWPELDYRRFPKNGTELVEFVRVTPR
jgi:hypothetical protein